MFENTIPDPIRRPKYGHVGVAVAIVIASNRDVANRPELARYLRTVAALRYVPSAVRGAPDRRIALSVAVKVEGLGSSGGSHGNDKRAAQQRKSNKECSRFASRAKSRRKRTDIDAEQNWTPILRNKAVTDSSAARRIT